MQDDINMYVTCDGCNNGSLNFFTIFYLLKTKPKKLSKTDIVCSQLQKYIKSFLHEFDSDKVDEFDLHTDKIAKYIFYRHNSYLESTLQNKQIIRQIEKVEHKFGLEKIQNKDLQDLVEKIIGHIEIKKKKTDTAEQKCIKN